ncbi:hypothetical protein, partial [Bacillus wiedmannii]|uniref:hypothetical protein n=1 Tax=Bacillus wiedmannii TaxID=1890302 RepID=UPI0034D5961F
MEKWTTINIKGIPTIEKCVAEFRIWEIGTIPSAKFKIKIYENQKGHFNGFTNLGIKINNCPEFGVGSGKSIEEALENTIEYFMNEINEQKKLKELTDDDFEWAHPDDF